MLLGSIATDKYVEPLTAAFGERVLVPADFAGRGDMSRGGLLLRCVEDGQELDLRFRDARGAARSTASAPRSQGGDPEPRPGTGAAAEGRKLAGSPLRVASTSSHP